jgi:hypothetical protein
LGRKLASDERSRVSRASGGSGRDHNAMSARARSAPGRGAAATAAHRGKSA